MLYSRVIASGSKVTGNVYGAYAGSGKATVIGIVMDIYVPITGNNYIIRDIRGGMVNDSEAANIIFEIGGGRVNVANGLYTSGDDNASGNRVEICLSEVGTAYGAIATNGTATKKIAFFKTGLLLQACFYVKAT